MVCHLPVLATAEATVSISKALLECSGTPADPMKANPYTLADVGTYSMTHSLLAQIPATLLSAVLLFTSSALACEKHINGHQNSSDTNAEGYRK